eukprot:TRINITY_DN439_c0_g1_i1.p1 TRINITY_DN439_c0_g1~~TRINITY_DN439_c0_g1_i1.p1  ORF type:complete len:315 (+),score=97.60 TRINITY_DN439_c0_g1_i1:115-1059(+)
MELCTRGLLTRAQTGGLDLVFGSPGSPADILKLLHDIANGVGFGALVGQGVRRMKALFAEKFGIDPKFMKDIGMESKGLEFSEYITKESLAQQGGYGLALKGPQHDEAWLIFLDMVHNYMPTFEQKAEALHWFPMWRTWFGLCGLCKLPWNDVVPEDNKTTAQPSKVAKHLEWYRQFYNSVTGASLQSVDEMIQMSERVYNFQRVFGLRQGLGTAEHDELPYRAVGPVTKEEYESRAERYDKQLTQKYGFDIMGKTTAEKVAELRRRREAQYQELKQAVYLRRGWSPRGVPTPDTLKRLGIATPELLTLVSSWQ